MMALASMKNPNEPLDSVLRFFINYVAMLSILFQLQEQLQQGLLTFQIVHT